MTSKIRQRMDTHQARESLHTLVEAAADGAEAIAIAHGGKVAAVLLSAQEYDMLCGHARKNAVLQRESRGFICLEVTAEH